MKIKKLISLVFYSTLFFSQVTSAADDTCSIKSINHPLINGRGFKITFPDGKTFEVVGHTHGDRNAQFEVLKYLDQVDEFDNDTIAELEKMLSPRKTTINHFSGDIEYLEQKLETSKDNFVIWVEGSENTVKQFQGFHKITYDKQVEKIPSKNSHAVEVIKNAFLFATGSSVNYMYLLDKIPHGFEVKGVETTGPEIKRLNAESDELDSQSISFSQMGQLDPSTVDAAISKFTVLWNQQLEAAQLQELLDFDVSKIDEFIDRFDTSPVVSRSLKMRLKSFLLRQQVSILRDRNNSQKMIDEGNSGVFFVGLLHLKPTIKMLKEKCEAASWETSDSTHSIPNANRYGTTK